MATPTEWLSEFQVNTGSASAGNQTDSLIVGLSNGNFLVAWTELGNAITTGVDIIGKIYDAEGNLVRDSYRINDTRFTDVESQFDIQPTNDGGFIIVYADRDGDNTDIIWERKNSAGVNVNDAVIASETSADEDLQAPQVAVNLLDNTSVVTYVDDFDAGAGEDFDIEAQQVSATGVLGAQFNAGENTSEQEFLPDIAILTNGNYVSVYEQDDLSNPPKVKFRIFTPTGSFVAAQEVAPGGIGDRAPVVTSLTNGNFVVAWLEEAPSGSFDFDIKAQVYTSTGALVGGTILAANTLDFETEPAIIALPDGDFVIAWHNDTDDALEARRFNPDGTSDGSTFTVTGPVATLNTLPDIGVTGDGRILFSWGDGEIFASIWDPRGSTIDADDYSNVTTNILNSSVVTSGITSSTVIGTLGSQTILGQSGDDTLDGAVGRGRAIDTIKGGAGNDVIIIGDDENIDNVDGGSGTDVLDLSAVSSFFDAVTIDFNTNFFSGFGGVTTIERIEEVIGTQFNDVIIADAQRDVLRGQDGNDELTGGGGSDRLFGDRNNDTLTGEGAGDIMNGGSGNDELFGNGGADNLIGGGGDDTLIGGTGNDTLTGGAGKDRLTGNNGGDVFDFNSLAETPVGAQRDIITDFDLAADFLDLSDIDANSILGGDQAFTFIGSSAYSGTAGELRFSNAGSNTIARGDVNGDALDDFQIQLVGTITLRDIDFIL